MSPELEMDPVIDTSADPDVATLNSFLRGELSARETYSIVLDKYGESVRGMDVLLANRASHEERITRLTYEIVARGGEASEESGAWGALAKMVEGVAAVIGYEAALVTLEEGEDHGQKAYERDLDMMSAACRELCRSYLIPEQVATHAALKALLSGKN